MPLHGSGHSSCRRRSPSPYPEGPLPNRRPSAGASLSFLVLRASMTLEAALVLPLFLLFFVCLFSIFDMIRLESTMMAALHEAGTAASEYAYYLRYAKADLTGRPLDFAKADAAETGSGISGQSLAKEALEFFASESAVRGMVVNYLGEDYLENSVLADGGRSISYLQTELLTADDHIDLVADYRVEPFGASIFGLSRTGLQARYYGHAFTGYALGDGSGDGQADENVEIVFITPSGTVYHRDRNCRYLHIDSYPVSAGSVPGARNQGGAKYYPCERCHPALTGTLYITTDGNRYHASQDCSSLKRTVLEVPLSEVQDTRRPCSKCGGGS